MGWDDQMTGMKRYDQMRGIQRTIWASTKKMFRNSTTLWFLGLSPTLMISLLERNCFSHRRLQSPRFSNRKLSNNNSYQWSHPSSAMTPRSVSLQCGQVFLWAWFFSSSCANFSSIMLITSTVPFLTTKPQLEAWTNDLPSLVEMLYLWSLTWPSPNVPSK